MSTGARWTIAIVGVVCAISFAIVALIVPPDTMNRTGLWCMTGFCTLIALACFPGPFQKVAIRLIAVAVAILDVNTAAGGVLSGGRFG